MTKRTIIVQCEDREDGGLQVWSDDLPGLILSGPNRAKVLGAIGPAVRALCLRRGENPDVLVNATFTTGEPKEGEK